MTVSYDILERSISAINSLFLDFPEMSQFDSHMLNTDASARGTRRNASQASYCCPASFYKEAFRLRVQLETRPEDRREGSGWHIWFEVELLWRDV